MQLPMHLFRYLWKFQQEYIFLPHTNKMFCTFPFLQMIENKRTNVKNSKKRRFIKIRIYLNGTSKHYEIEHCVKGNNPIFHSSIRLWQPIENGSSCLEVFVSFDLDEWQELLMEEEENIIW